jgi:ribosomal protein S18 acetylase RimI-like enzyme
MFVRDVSFPAGAVKVDAITLLAVEKGRPSAGDAALLSATQGGDSNCAGTGALAGLPVGYVTLAVDVVRLSAGKRERLGRTNFPDFGAMRLVMIGVDADFHGRGIGDTLLKWTVGKARSLAEEVAFRFVLADVNLVRKNWYDKRQFQVNRAAIYKPEEPERSTVSMLLDLMETEERGSGSLF